MATHQTWYDGTGEIDLVDLVHTEASTVIVKDSNLETRDKQARAQLRCLPLFQAVGFDQVLHTDLWSTEYNLLEYDHREPLDVDPKNLAFPLVHIVTQAGITEHGEEELVRRLVERSQNEEERYILVTDTTAPQTPSFTKKPGRSIVDDFPPIAVRDFPSLANTFISKALDNQSRIPVVTTRNVLFHTASALHAAAGAPADSIEGLFEYRHAPAASPVWDAAHSVLDHGLDDTRDRDALVEVIEKGLESWMESDDAGQIAMKIVQVLDTCDFAESAFEEYRQQTPEYR